MNEWQMIISAAAIIVAALSYKLPHAVMWIALGAANAVACDVFYAYGLNYPAAFTLACDCLVCLCINWFATEKWESGLFAVFQVSALISILRLSGILAEEGDYLLLLELCNYAALALIGGTAILGGAGDRLLRRRWRSYVLWAYHYLRAPPAKAHWWKADQ